VPGRESIMHTCKDRKEKKCSETLLETEGKQNADLTPRIHAIKITNKAIL